MRTITFTVRQFLHAVVESGWDKKVGMPISDLKPPPDELLDKLISVQIPETIEEFDKLEETSTNI